MNVSILVDAGCGCDDPKLIVDESTANVSTIILDSDSIWKFTYCCWNSADDPGGWRSSRKGANGNDGQ